MNSRNLWKTGFPKSINQLVKKRRQLPTRILTISLFQRKSSRANRGPRFLTWISVEEKESPKRLKPVKTLTTLFQYLLPPGDRPQGGKVWPLQPRFQLTENQKILSRNLQPPKHSHPQFLNPRGSWIKIFLQNFSLIQASASDVRKSQYLKASQFRKPLLQWHRLPPQN